MWYLSPFSKLYDLVQFGLGQRKVLERESDGAGRKVVVPACGVKVDDDDDEAEAEVEVNACAEGGYGACV